MTEHDPHHDRSQNGTRARRRLPSLEQHLSLYIITALASTFILGFLAFGLSSLFG
ncbi:hypothetical protein C7446_2063 [Kushneria sinocarnis]|uniref:Uncharacterized protein n=1 Tax=Kushneria sinocarnis TaxID=595502 RepID=A0A420WWN0_9GAMM|nr:hypothetical protein [Kushneria sinocarnis]RKR03538.1 hypothetical protein C7446_2063 [Kushneria sinocarnis]